MKVNCRDKLKLNEYDVLKDEEETPKNILESREIMKMKQSEYEETVKNPIEINIVMEEIQVKMRNMKFKGHWIQKEDLN